MGTYIAVSLAAGLLFGVLDGILNGNPLARRLFAAYAPIARPRINVAAGVAIDLAYGFLLAAIYLQLAPSLPGATGLAKGAAYGVVVWFFRVVMAAASNYLTFAIPARALLYTLAAGLLEMLILGLLVGYTI
jgi:hypothetical protein